MRRVRATSLCTKSRWQLRHVTRDIWLFANKPRGEASEFHGRDWNLERALALAEGEAMTPHSINLAQVSPYVYFYAHRALEIQ